MTAIERCVSCLPLPSFLPVRRQIRQRIGMPACVDICAVDVGSEGYRDAFNAEGSSSLGLGSVAQFRQFRNISNLIWIFRIGSSSKCVLMAGNGLRNRSIGTEEEESNECSRGNTDHNPSVICHKQQPVFPQNQILHISLWV